MKRLQGGFRIGALVWLRGAVLVGAACLAASAGMAQSIRLVPSTARFAGAVTGTQPSDGGLATTVPLNAPAYVASDLSGNIYIADTGNNCVRRVDTSGNMTVVVGQPTGSGDTCLTAGSVTADPATGVLIPSGLALNAAGDLFIADTGHNCVRRLPAGNTGTAALQPLFGSACTEPSSSAVAPAPAGLAVDAAGNLYIAVNDSVDHTYQVIRTGPGSGYGTGCLVSGAVSAAVGTQCTGITGGVALVAPQGLALDVIGNLYIADSGNACIREVTAAGAAITAAGKCTNDGASSNSTILQKPVGLAADAAGHVYINDEGAGQISELAANQLELIAGDGGITPYAPSQDGRAAVSASLLNPQGLAADKTGNVYVADTNNNIVRILAQGLHFPETLVGNHSQPQNLWFMITNAVTLTTAPSGDFPASGLNSCQGSITVPPGVVKTCQVVLRFLPTLPGLRTAPLTITDSSTSPANIYRFGLNGIGQSAEAIFVPGTIKTLAGSLAQPSAIAIDSAGDVYYAESGTGAISVLPAGSGAPTQLIAPGGAIQTPSALAIDAAGNLYIADSTGGAIYQYDANGNLTPWASGLDHPVALAADQLGDLYVAEDGATVGVLEIYAGGQKSFIAGQGSNGAPNGVLATAAKFVHPSALYLDPAGDLYIADRGGFRVYQIDTAGIIRFFAGNGTATDTNPTTRTGIGLAGVSGISADPAGDIYITDAGSNRLFLAYSGQAQNPEVALLAGNIGGAPGYTGDNGPASAAELDNPMAVAVDGGAEVFIADTGNSALREITYTDPTLDFGTVKVGQTGGPLGTTLWNAGNGALSPLTFGLDDQVNFAVDTIGCGGSLAEGSTCNFSFFFTPQSPGSFVGHEILSDNGVTPSQTITLIGNAPPPPVATMNAPPVTVVYGDAYTLAATITGNQPSAPTGTATFSIAGSPLCPAQPLPANGAVACSPSPTLEDAGTYSVTVSYSGDSTYPASTVTLTLVVTPRPVTITADNKTRPINTANPPLTGTVANVVPGQSITATYSTTAVTSSPAGAYPITPAYVIGPGTKASNYAITVINGTLTVTTTGATPAATIAAPAVTGVYGDAYTLAAAITGNQPSGPTGTATFSIAGAALCPVQPLPANGAVACSPSATLEDAGTYSVTVSYSGDSTYPASTVNITLVVAPRPVTITADNKTRPVNTANPAFTGTIANVVPGQSITATYSTTATTSSPAGTYPITPAYTIGAGTKASDYAVTVVNGTLTVTTTGGGGSGGSFTLAATPPEQEIDHNGTVNYPVNLASTGGFTGPISLTCSGLPEGASCAFAPASVTLASGATGTSTMTITATADTSNVPTIFSNLRDTQPGPKRGSSPLLAWTMLPLGLFGSGGMLFGARRRRRLLLLLLPFALLAAALGVTGCAAPSNYKIYTVTVTGTATSSGATITQSSTVNFVLAR